jgi:hypothetical protein
MKGYSGIKCIRTYVRIRKHLIAIYLSIQVAVEIVATDVRR